MLDGQLRGDGVRGCMGGFFIFMFARLSSMIQSRRCYWYVELVSWTGYSMGFMRIGQSWMDRQD